MKKTLLLLIITGCILYSGCSDITKDEFRVTGTIEGLDNITGTIAVKDDTVANGLRYDEIKFTDGNFFYAGHIESPEVMRVWINKDEVKKIVGKGYIPVKSSSLWFIARPGQTTEISGKATDFVDAYPVGDHENDILATLMKSIIPVINESGNAMVELRKNGISDEERKTIESRIEKLDKREQDLKTEFLNKNISSIAALWLMEDMVIRHQIEMDKIDLWMQKVDTSYSSLSYYQSLQKRIKGYKDSRVGQIAPEIITGNTPDGSIFKLSSLRGKYVLLDFWGTWCGSCIEGIPAMKKFYNIYSDRLEIVGLAKDRDAKVWKDFIINSQMNWKHVLVGEGKDNFVEQYNVAGYPTKILLSPEGKILHRKVGEEEGYYEEIEKFIK